MKRFRKIQFLYFLNALIFCFASLFTTDSIDISLHDTYFVIPTSYILLLLAIPFVVFAITVILMVAIHRPLNIWLSLFHYLITSIGIAYLCFPKSNSLSSINEWITIVVILILLAQILFIVNVIRSFVMKPRN